MIICIPVKGYMEVNSYLWANEETRHAFLIDPGARGDLLLDYCDQNGWVPEAILLTHGHSDHVSSLPVIEGRTGVTVYATDGTAATVEREGRREKPDLEWNFAVFAAGEPFSVGDLDVEPFPVPHDAADPVGFVLRAPSGVR